MNRAFVFAICATGVCWTNLHARPAHKQALGQYFGQFLSKKLNDCRMCHLPDAPNAKEEENVEKPHNPFGARLKAVRNELRKAGKPTTIDARLDAVLNEDADGDGVSNLLEILSGHFPGDKDDRATPDEVAKSKSALAAFTKFRASYPWRPFEPVARPALPKVQNERWLRNPIDAFIAAEHESLGLKPRPEAPKAVLLRRIYIDLIGLPPTPAELHGFLQDDSPQAYEKVVDRLLADARYGERWGRHWMDVWRYSDWAGYGPQVRDSQPHIWRWRDWIIDSLNADAGYDSMILDMLAGDEIAPEDPKKLTGTGYLVRNYKLLSREKWMQDVVEHTFMAFQGVTIGCAKCHDHMYDPILQSEYYQARAIFEPHDVRTDRLPGKPDTKIDGLPRAFDKDLAAPTLFFIRGDDRTPDKTKKIVAGVPDALGGNFPKIDAVSLPKFAATPDLRPFVIEETIQASVAEVAKMQAGLQKLLRTTQLARLMPDRFGLSAVTLHVKYHDSINALHADHELVKAKHEALMYILAVERLEDQGVKQGPKWEEAAMAATRAQRAAALLEAQKNLRLAKDGTAKKKGPSLADAEKALAKAEIDSKLPVSTNFTRRNLPTYPAQSTGRRLALAKWLADKENPLTARVAVNHIWLRHFGQALVPTVFDFGRNGRPPSHPALVDWLASELMHKDWKMKHLHRLIVTSSTYRQASTPDEANAKLDRDNKYLWRYLPHRVEAEVVRDSVLYVAGRLDLKLGGPDIDYPLGLTVPRRSLYFRHAAEKQMEFLVLFDAASVSECYERQHSIVPQQALALFNSDISLRSARLLARKLHAHAKEDRPFLVAAFEHALSRSPTEDELTECTTFLREQSARLAQSKNGATGLNPEGSLPAPDANLRARENLVHVLLNHHDFVTLR